MNKEAIALVLLSTKPQHLDTDPNDCREAWMTWAKTVDEFVKVLYEVDRDFNRLVFYKLCGVA